MRSVLAANRDEFLARRTTPAAWHSFLPPFSPSPTPSPTTSYLSGLDLQGGGTWLGISLPPSDTTTERLRFATLTNYTELLPPNENRPSRGNLVKDFLTGSSTLAEYLDEISLTKAQYAGFNLLVGSLSAEGFRMGYITNREPEGKEGRILEDGGVWAVSNSTIDVREGWEKIESGSNAFEEVVGKGKEGLVDRLWGVLSSANAAPIIQRTDLRKTVLVRPTYLNPTLPLPPPSTTLSPPTAAHLTPTLLTPADLSIPLESKGGTWYGTRVQTVVLIQRVDGKEEGGKGRWRVEFRERDAFVLGEEGPEWSAEERVFEFLV